MIRLHQAQQAKKPPEVFPMAPLPPAQTMFPALITAAIYVQLFL